MLNIPVNDPIPNPDVRDEYRVSDLSSCITLDDHKLWCEEKSPLMFAKVLYLYAEYKYTIRT